MCLGVRRALFWGPVPRVCSPVSGVFTSAGFPFVLPGDTLAGTLLVSIDFLVSFVRESVDFFQCLYSVRSLSFVSFSGFFSRRRRLLSFLSVGFLLAFAGVPIHHCGSSFFSLVP